MVSISWEDVTDDVIVQNWDESYRCNRETFQNITLGQLPGAVRRHSEAVLQAILAGTLMRQGWTVDYAPGRLRLHRRDSAIDPREVITRMRKRELTHHTWREMLVKFQVDPETRLGTGM